MYVMATNGRPTAVCIDATGTQATVDIDERHDGTRIRVEREHCWQFHAENLSARLVETDADDRCPDWVEELLLQLGIEEVVAE